MFHTTNILAMYDNGSLLCEPDKCCKPIKVRWINTIDKIETNNNAH